MQDIVFYVAAKETRGIVRDSANANTISAPNIVLGVSVCLKMRLFAACDVSTPFPIEKFTGIADWKWNMNAGFNRFGTVKVTSDPQRITVHSVIDTVDGNSMSFTEFVIPISEMNTQELEAYIGNEKEWSELNAELVGYSSAGDAEFVLQIKGFTIWNRIAGLGDPTVLDQEFATRSQTVRMIQEAVSSSAVTKQDLLTSANAGTNISIDENGIITNTYSLPLATTASAGGVALATAAETVSGSNAAKVVTPASFKAALTGDDQIIAQSALNAFQSITDFGTTLSVSLESGKAYKLSAVAGNHYLSVPNIPVGKYGMDAHLKLFVGETSLVHVQDPLILMDALIPNAVNNCVIKYRDGEARMYVEDHDVGYVVTSVNGTAGTSLDGSLYYGLTGTTASYVVFANALNGQIVTLPEAATVNRSVNVVGNGYTQTVLSGGISCTSKTTFSNLGMNGVSINGGTATFGDVFIPAGGTVSVNGGRLFVETVVGDGGTVNLGGVTQIQTGAQNAIISGIDVTGGTRGVAIDYNGATVKDCNVHDNVHNVNCAGLFTNCSCTIVSCSITGNTAGNYGGGIQCTGSNGSSFISSCTLSGNKAKGAGGIYIEQGATATLMDTVVSGNTATNGTNAGSDCYIASGTTLKISGGCKIGSVMLASNGGLFLAGSNTFDFIGHNASGASVTVSSGATINLTGNTNATPINPGGGIVFGSNVTIYPSAGSASAVEISGGTFQRITNGAVVVGLDTKANETVDGHNTATLELVEGIYSYLRTGATLQNFTVTGGIYQITVFDGSTIKDCTLSCRIAGFNAASCTLAGTVKTNYRINTGASDTCTYIIASGAIIDLTGNTNATPIYATGAAATSSGGIFISSGGISIIDSAGTTHEFQDLAITGATINNLGQIFGATVSVPVSSTGVGPWNVSTTLGSSTVSATDEAQELVIDGGLVSIQEL